MNLSALRHWPVSLFVAAGKEVASASVTTCSSSTCRRVESFFIHFLFYSYDIIYFYENTIIPYIIMVMIGFDLP